MLLDVMWNIENLEQVNAFITALPYKDRIDAMGLLKIAIDESLEHEGELDKYQADVARVIDKARAV